MGTCDRVSEGEQFRKGNSGVIPCHLLVLSHKKCTDVLGTKVGNRLPDDGQELLRQFL